MSDGGKGSKARPYSITQEEFARKWDAIFNKQPTTSTENNSKSEKTDSVALKNDVTES